LLESRAPADEILVRAATALTAPLNVRQTCLALLDVVERIFGARASWILLHDAPTDHLVTAAYRGPGADYYKEFHLPCDRGVVGAAFTQSRPVFVADIEKENRWTSPARMFASGLRSVFAVPLQREGSAIGVLGLDSPRFSAARPPTPGDITRLVAIAAHAAVAITNARQFESVEADCARLQRLVDERPPRTDGRPTGSTPAIDRPFPELVGGSPAFCRMLDHARVVAPADSTVLLMGETGTGKELVARRIHAASRRSGGPFVAVDCAALPDSLVESELFGHERGAFTGALQRQPGRIELANRGTLFLDEVGDLPLPAQAKLLRVLQECEVVRLGSTASIRVNVRLIAATNQNLEAKVREGRFRMDLFYRLSVFPMVIPPLRERPGDIALLAAHFLKGFAGAIHTDVREISPAALHRLDSYSWPGNVRELQNVMERAVILARGPVIDGDAIVLNGACHASTRHEASAAPDGTAEDDVVSFSEAERRAIVRALERTGWRISGKGGSAEVLGLKPTTLHAKMKKLGIRRPSLSHARGAASNVV
jgi:formate hydrogenlyase transcriptional activator